MEMVVRFHWLLLPRWWKENQFWHLTRNINRVFITESQKGWGCVRRDIWKSAGPNPAAQAGQPRAGCPGQCPNSFWRSPQGLHNLSNQPSTVLHHPHSKEMFPDVQREPLIIQFVAPLPLILLLDTAQKSGSAHIAPSPQVFLDIDDTPQILSSPGWTVPALSASPRRDAPNL